MATRISHVCIALLLGSIATCAEAGGWYLETGFGAGQLRGTESFFGGPMAPTSTGIGLGENASLAKIFGNSNALVQVHLGVQQRLTQGSDRNNSYALLSVYPMIRLETSRFYIGFGATPFIWGHAGDSFFLSGYNPKQHAYGGFIEAGLLWRLVPFFNLALAGSAEAVHTSAGMGPAPAVQGTFQMRFYLGDGHTTSGPRHKYDGWRYPFGIELF